VKASANGVPLYRTDKEDPTEPPRCRTFIHVNKSAILTLKSFYISKAVNITVQFGIICDHLPCCATTKYSSSVGRHIHGCAELKYQQ
jgi:hypothetical protein